MGVKEYSVSCVCPNLAQDKFVDKCGRKFFVHKIQTKIRLPEDEKMLPIKRLGAFSCLFRKNYFFRDSSTATATEGSTDYGHKLARRLRQSQG